MIEKVLWKILIISTWLNVVASGLQSNKNFLKCNPRKQLSHKNRAGFWKILICEEENGVPQWQFTDGSSTVGEVFNPARDCSDVVDHVPDARDGFYWIALDNKTKHEVWCDLYTDGGGFMLVGMKDSPVTWTVPSNSTPVNPQGPPHWSSVLGNVQVLDFGIQFSSDGTFQLGTEAHWFYRLKQKRQLGKLFTNDKSSGCSTNDPGIGDVMFVKDVRTGSIATKNFKCSKFGPHTHPSLGWGRMNYCLRHGCKNGYGVFPGPLPVKYTQYGCFSYSAVSTISGTHRNATAFVGCDNGMCCACFGPKGGRLDYCGPKCTAINGGTVVKKVHVWFWVRTRMPERVWKRCMQFMMKNSSGNLETYFIDRQTGAAHKGSCAEQSRTILNEGTMTVPDKESLKKIPDIPGLLSYRKDNKQLYVNQGSKWQALSEEQEVKRLQQEVKFLENTMKTQKNNIQNLNKKVKTQENKVHSQSKTVEIQEKNIHNLKQKILKQDIKFQKKFKTQEKQAQNVQKKIQNQEIKIKTQENKIQTLRRKIQIQERKIKTIENHGQRRSKEIQNQGNLMKKHENELQGVLNLVNKYQQIEPSCSILKTKLPSTASGMYFIKLQGLDISVPVYCDMTSKNGVGVTEIGHDSENRTYVHGYEIPGSYKQKIKYHLSMEQVVAIISQSRNCEQFIKYECSDSVLVGRGYGWWVSRQGSRMNYWGGAAVNSGKCACAMSNSCALGKMCNCDVNDRVLREDSGYLTDKKTLPVAELRFGDTGDISISGQKEYGYHTLGKLRCWG